MDGPIRKNEQAFWQNINICTRKKLIVPMYNFDQATKELHKQIDVNVDTTGVSERIYLPNHPKKK